MDRVTCFSDCIVHVHTRASEDSSRSVMLKGVEYSVRCRCIHSVDNNCIWRVVQSGVGSMPGGRRSDVDWRTVGRGDDRCSDVVEWGDLGVVSVELWHGVTMKRSEEYY
ncbi:hypothetical protein Tco_0566430 [Tanacetum coccineum]